MTLSLIHLKMSSFKALCRAVVHNHIAGINMAVDGLYAVTVHFDNRPSDQRAVCALQRGVIMVRL